MHRHESRVVDVAEEVVVDIYSSPRLVKRFLYAINFVDGLAEFTVLYLFVTFKA